MKRSSTDLLAFLLMLAVASTAQLQAANGPRKPAAPPRAKAQPPKNFTTAVWGDWKETREEAWQDALEQARIAIGDYFQSRQPALRWTPTADFIQRRLIKGEDKEEKDFGAGIGAMNRIQLHLDVNERDYQNMLQLARQALSERRMHFAGQALAGLVALMLSVAGYVRLEEWSKGYYTLWLRLALVGCRTRRTRNARHPLHRPAPGRARRE